MLRIRRFIAIAAVAGAVMLPFSFSAAQPAAAYCENSPTGTGGSGCSNTCKKLNGALTKVHPALGDLFLCLQ